MVRVSGTPISLLGLVVMVHYCHGTVLSLVTKVALDLGRPLEARRVRALYAAYSRRSPLWVQVWNRTSNPHNFSLDWQVRVEPQLGDGSIEVWNLNESQFLDADPNNQLLAIMNEDIPGPLDGSYSHGARVVLSLLNRAHQGFPLTHNVEFEFDNLELPYHLPIYLCNETDCPHELGTATKDVRYPKVEKVNSRMEVILPRPTPPLEVLERSTESRILSEQMLVGLITWNIVLTLMLLIVLLVLVFICADLEKRKKETSRYNYSFSDDAVFPSAIFPSPIFHHNGYDNPGMTEIRDDDSEPPLTREAFEKLPSSRF